MIVYEKEKAFIFIAQHDHAQVSGALMSFWSDEWLVGNERKPDLIYAAYQHDRGWMDLDSWPLWNDADHRPYSFLDFPAKIRFLYYAKGLDEVQRANEYAALLCSLLYTTLAKRFINDDSKKFIQQEYERQTRLQKRLSVQEEQLQLHLNALVLCDELSLFVCMQQPGTPRQRYEWFADGFRFSVPGSVHTRLYADWRDEEHVQLFPFPFDGHVQTVVPYKEVNKADIAKYGIAKAYHNEQMKQFAIKFIK